MYQYLLCVGRIVHDLARSGHLAKFDGSELELLLAFLGHLNFEAGTALVSDKTLGNESGVSYPTANRGLNALVAKGYLTRLEGGYSCGPVLLGMLAAHEQQVVFSGVARRDNSVDVQLSELQARAAERKATTTSDIRQLVLRYGGEAVDRAILAMEAQYPDDGAIRTSFGALVRRACESSWVHTKSERAAAKQVEAKAIAAATPPETAVVAIDAEGRRLPVLERWSSGAVLVEVVDSRGRKTTATIPPAMFSLYRWG